MRLLSFTILFLASVSGLKAQAPLPKGFAPGEQRSFIGVPELPQSPNVFYTPPTGSELRTAAEWEEMEAITITWTSYQSVLKEIVRNTQSQAKVYIICGSTCSGSTDSTSIKNYLTTYSVPLTNLKFLYAPCNSVWIRDYGPNSVYRAGVDSLVIVDWKYNRPTRVKDDTVPRSLGRKMNIPVYETSKSPSVMINTGGNFMCDGFGNAFSSELVLDENPGMTASQVDQMADTWMGLNRYTHMATLPYDGIHHIDMHMKLLDEETLLVGEYPQGVADGPQIEANLQYVLSNFNSVFGTPYKVIRIPMPPDQGYYPDQGGDYLTYANATIINKTIIVPQYYAQYDTTALRIWRQAMPGYTVVGINSNVTIPASGSLHCITNSVGVQDPLLISHKRLENTANTSSPYQVDATIRHRSGIAAGTVYYRTDTTQPYVAAAMSAVSGATWTGYIPAQPSGTTVYYYIKGEAVSGKVQNRPMPAPASYWKFTVSAPAGITAVNAPSATKVYPNPSHGLTCIALNTPNPTQGRIALNDLLGREVMEIFNGEFSAGDKNYFFDSSSLTAGVYTITISTVTGSSSTKVIVK